MARIVAALIARHDIEPFGEEIDDLAFALVAPLGAQDDYVSHFDQTYLFYRTRTEYRIGEEKYGVSGELLPCSLTVAARIGAYGRGRVGASIRAASVRERGMLPRFSARSILHGF